jgi:CHASE2 domain-containing sensor protein
MASPAKTPPGKSLFRRSSLAWSLGTIIIIVGLKTFFEHKSFVQNLERETYEFLQQRIVSGGTTEQPDVLVIDLSTIKPQPWERDGLTGIATPRAPVKELIEVFAELRARSIGIDVDFSPKDGRPMHPDDLPPKDWRPMDPDDRKFFFQECLELSEKTGVDIFLGVYRTYEERSKWLGDDRYISLAAAIASRTIDHGLATHWIAVKKGRAPLPSMSAALAGEDVNVASKENSFFGWFVESTWTVPLGPNLRTAESVIDFSTLKRIRQDVLPAVKPEFYRAMPDRIKNRMILIGDTKPEGGDSFTVPGVTGAVPGVFLHACAANTIANEPLYSLTLLGRITIDLLLAVSILALVKFSLWLLARTKRKLMHAEHKLDILFTVLTVVLVLIVSVVFVRQTRLLWTDFLLVCAVLLVQLIVDIVASKATSSPENADPKENQTPFV